MSDTNKTKRAVEVPEVQIGDGQDFGNLRPVEGRLATLSEPPPVAGATGEAWPAQLWEVNGRPAFAAVGLAQVVSEDPQAFVVRVADASMEPRFPEGEYALVEPSLFKPEAESDVLVRLADGKVLLRRLISSDGGVKLGTYQGEPATVYSAAEVSWMYRVTRPVSAHAVSVGEGDVARTAMAAIRSIG